MNPKQLTVDTLKALISRYEEWERDVFGENKASNKTILKEFQREYDLKQVELELWSDCGLSGLGESMLSLSPTTNTAKEEAGCVYKGDWLVAADSNLKRCVVKVGTRCIGKEAFKDCESLEEVVIPEGVVYIAKGAFYNCWSLKRLCLPSSVTCMGENPFYRSGVENLEIQSKAFVLEGGLLYTSDHRVLISSLRPFDAEPQIAEETLEIGALAFANYECGKRSYPCRYSFERIVLPNRCHRLGERCFDTCWQCKSVLLNSNLITIGKKAFRWCQAIEEIEFPLSVKRIGDYAFEHCTAKKSDNGSMVVGGLRKAIFNGFALVAQTIFDSCSNLGSIVVPNNCAYELKQCLPAGDKSKVTSVTDEESAIKYDIFISHRKQDGNEIAEILCRELEGRGFRVFKDSHEVVDGRFAQRIEAGLKNSEIFILILSERVLDQCDQDEDWIRREIALAYRYEKKVLPVFYFKESCFEFPSFLPSDITKIRDEEQSLIANNKLQKITLNKMVEDRIVPYLRKDKACYKAEVEGVRVVIEAGNIFEQSGTKLIHCRSDFDFREKRNYNEQSVAGQFVRLCMEAGVPIPRTDRQELGNVVEMRINDEPYVAVAFCNMTGCCIEEMSTADYRQLLYRMWRSIASNALIQRDRLVMTPFGGRVASVGNASFSLEQRMAAIVLSYFNAVSVLGGFRELHICITEEEKQQIDFEKWQNVLLPFLHDMVRVM